MTFNIVLFFSKKTSLPHPPTPIAIRLSRFKLFHATSANSVRRFQADSLFFVGPKKSNISTGLNAGQKKGPSAKKSLPHSSPGLPHKSLAPSHIPALTTDFFPAPRTPRYPLTRFLRPAHQSADVAIKTVSAIFNNLLLKNNSCFLA